jgi:hemoglobin
MTYAFGGAQHWNGHTMRNAHQELVTEMGLSDRHFDAIAEDLVATLVELEVPPALIDEVLLLHNYLVQPSGNSPSGFKKAFFQIN